MGVGRDVGMIVAGTLIGITITWGISKAASTMVRTVPVYLSVSDPSFSSSIIDVKASLYKKIISSYRIPVAINIVMQSINPDKSEWKADVPYNLALEGNHELIILITYQVDPTTIGSIYHTYNVVLPTSTGIISVGW